MFHFLKSTFRIFRRNATHTLINLIGLSIGLASGVLILLYVFNETSFDRFHEKYKDIYRVNMIFINQDGSLYTHTIPAAVGPSLNESFSDIQSVTRLTHPREGYFIKDDKLFTVRNIVYADSTFFDNFSFRLIQGDSARVLNGPGKIVLTETASANLFGKDEAMGKILRDNKGTQFVITGIVADPPQNSTIGFGALLSFSSLYQDKSIYFDWNGSNQFINYVRTEKDFNQASYQQLLEPFLDEKINKFVKNNGVRFELRFEPLSDIHLHPISSDDDSGALGNIKIFSAIALLIILIASFNFTSLATAKALRRSREIGIRKVSGASRGALIRQFMGEALLMSFMAMGVALIIIELAQPWYNTVSGLSLNIYSSQSFMLILSVLIMVIITGILAGAYPAFYLSSFNPVKVLRGGALSVKTRNLIPKILVVTQFTISAGLISCSLIIFNQLRYIRDFDPGFHTKNILVLYLSAEESASRKEILGSELLSIPGVKSWTAVSDPPGVWVSTNGYLPEGYKDVVLLNIIDTDTTFLQTMGLSLVSGRNFVAGSAYDSTAYLVNEAFTRQFGMPDPIGKVVYRSGKHPIIGVVKDFHFSSLHEPIKPLLISMNPESRFNYILLQVDPRLYGNINQQAEARWKKLFPEQPYLSLSLNTMIADHYATEQHFARLFSGFTLLAIVVACLGLFGLSAVILQQRRRNLGIRKILGASPKALILKESLRYLKLVFLANILAAIPIWLIMSQWMANFSYSVGINPFIFLVTLAFTLLIAWLTVLWQSRQAARISLVQVINYE
ncbi:MAG: ABC transporter permease [Lentimicrobium sp.]|nr:ABC transporter permease [Lentimicrobium sp.]